MTYVLKDINKKYLKPLKNYPNKQSLSIPLPYYPFHELTSSFYGNTIIDNRNIKEINDTTVDATLYFDDCLVNYTDNNGEYKKITVPSEHIYLQHLFLRMLRQEKNSSTNAPIYLRQINKSSIFKKDKDSDDYTLLTSIPQRLQNLAKSSEKTGQIQLGYVRIADKNDVIENGTKNSYDIYLKYPSYTITFYFKNDEIHGFHITRGEIVEAFSTYQNQTKANQQTIINNVIETETAAVTTNDYDILRHINHKSISYNDSGTATVAVNIPESLKGKASTWWCAINVPKANIVNEGKYKNNYFVSIRLYRTEYEADIPTTPTSNYHKNVEVKWEHAIVSRDEIIEANEKHIQKMAEFFKDFDRLVEP